MSVRKTACWLLCSFYSRAGANYNPWLPAVNGCRGTARYIPEHWCGFEICGYDVRNKIRGVGTQAQRIPVDKCLLIVSTPDTRLIHWYQCCGSPVELVGGIRTMMSRDSGFPPNRPCAAAIFLISSGQSAKGREGILLGTGHIPL